MSFSSETRMVSSRSLGRKLGVALALLGVLVIALSGLIVANLASVQVDALKFAEETREARLADNLLTNLTQIQVPTPERPRSQKSRVALLARSRQLMSSLYEGPHEGADPSDQEHQNTELSIIRELTVSLDRFELLSAEANSSDEAEVTLARISELAESIRDETEEEAARASQDLYARVDGLVWVTILAAAAALALLVPLLLFVHRSVIRPLRTLQQGTQRFGRGELDHRIDIGSDDEIGDLAREFNKMANSLDESHRELEERVEERTRQFVRAARLADLGTFAAGIAHEVNTPLASIASCAEGLERRVSTGQVEGPEQTEYLQTIAREAYRAHEITDRLLAFARAEPGPADALRLEESIDEVGRLLHHQMESRGVTAHYEIEASLPPVDANASDLKQVILNMLKNALDATPDGGSVWLLSRLRGHEIHTQVQDQGPGVAEEDMKRIFDPFFTTKEPGKGTGLGLPLASRAARSFSMRSASSRPGFNRLS